MGKYIFGAFFVLGLLNSIFSSSDERISENSSNSGSLARADEYTNKGVEDMIGISTKIEDGTLNKPFTENTKIDNFIGARND